MMPSKGIIVLAALALAACSRVAGYSDGYPAIYPDYVGVTVPEGTARLLKFSMADGSRCRVTADTQGDTTWFAVVSKGVAYKPFPVVTSHDAIDPYIAYRLIEPGYESWHDISICQRNLSSYRETVIVSNRENNQGCINCHNFQQGNPDRMMFHARGKGGGTVFIDGDDVRLLNLASVGPKKQGVYPAWHPDGRYIAFSSNSTHQCFFTKGSQPLEVYDTSSDIIVFDTKTDSVLTCPVLMGDDELETFPCWSGDGKTLYYCSAKAVEDIPHNFRKLHYRLMSIGFENGQFVGAPQIVLASDSASVSFPRVKGNLLMYTRSDGGTFPIWHREADLWMLDLSTGENRRLDELDSDDTESYHSWSGNGSWVVFSSRRDDSRYTRLYIAHHDGNGHFGKPFMLPQRNPADNGLRLKSYNIPEFINGEVPDHRESIAQLFK